MSVLRPRNRLVYFRISEDEFQRLRDLCDSEGARSISDLARLAVERLVQGGPTSSDAMTLQRVQLLDRIIRELNLKLEQLNMLLNGRGSKIASKEELSLYIGSEDGVRER